MIDLPNGKRGLAILGRVHISARKAAVAGMLGVVVLSFSLPSFAANPVDGCDYRVLNAAQATAQTRMAESKAIDDEIQTQPDSGLALSCFNQSAAVSAQQGGATFSGDFRAQAAPVVDDSLKAMFSNFSFSAGGSTGQVDYTSDNAVRMDTTTATPLMYNCTQINKLWNATNSQGVNRNAPYMTQGQLLDPTYTPPTGGAMFNAGLTNLNVSTARTGAVTMNDRLPTPAKTPPPACKGPAYNTPCKVLSCKGVGATVSSVTHCTTPMPGTTVCTSIPFMVPMVCP
jgi:hypothetical protein